MLARHSDGSPGAVRSAASATAGSADASAPRDDQALQEFRRSIDLGVAEAQAGLGDDWQTVQARMRARFPLPPR